MNSRPTILFLDIDEVLTSLEFSQRLRRERGRTRELEELDPLACARLERVIQETGAKIVLSSTWRILDPAHKVERILRDSGAPSARIVGTTPVIHNGRGREINEWLRMMCQNVESYAIVDDGEDAGCGHEPFRFVCTTQEHGLTDADATRLIYALTVPSFPKGVIVDWTPGCWSQSW